MRGTLPVFPGLEGEERKGLMSAEVSPAVTLQLLRSCWLTRGSRTPGPRPGHCSVRAGKADPCLLPDKPKGSQPLSREVLLTITFPLQGCPVLPQTPGSSVTCSRSLAVPGCVSAWPKGYDAAFAGAEMSGVAASTFIFSFHLPAKSSSLLLPLKA